MNKVERIPTGVDGLDPLIQGGFLKGNMIILAGGAGSGKTISSAQFLYNGAVKCGENGVYVSFAEGKKAFVENMKGLNMNFEKLVEEGKIKILDLIAMRKESFQSMLTHIESEVSSMNAKRLVIDPFTAMTQSIEEDVDRITLQSLFNRLVRATGCTTLLVSEVPLGSTGIGRGIEEFIVDGVILLESEVRKAEINRFLAIMKMRGTDHIRGKISYKITGNGVKILPQYESIPLKIPKENRLSLGIPELDESLGGGIPFGSICLIEVNGIVNFKPLYTLILKRGVEEENGLTYILSSRESWIDVEAIFQRYGLDAEKVRRKGRLDYVDYYQRIIVSGAPRKLPLVPEKLNADNLLRVLQELFEKRRGEGRRMWLTTSVIDEINLMGIEEYFRFYAKLTSMIKRETDVYLPYVNAEALEPRHLEVIRTFSDIIIQMYVSEGEHLLRILKTREGGMSRTYRMIFTRNPPYIQLF